MPSTRLLRVDLTNHLTYCEEMSPIGGVEQGKPQFPELVP